eukprot:5773554-Prymnesium_polylepis.1
MSGHVVRGMSWRVRGMSWRVRDAHGGLGPIEQRVERGLRQPRRARHHVDEGAVGPADDAAR